MPAFSAYIFDLNGTMIDDMSFHHEVWYDMLVNRLGAPLSREEVKHQLYGRNDELLARVFGAGRFTPEMIERISMEKEEIYQRVYRPHLALIAGLDDFLKRAEASGIRMGIGSAAIPFNINFVLDNLDIRRHFATVVSAEDVTESKPHPATFLEAAARLGAAPDQCLVFEDAPKGVEAAQRAGMKAVALTTAHPPEDFAAYTNVLFFARDYTDPRLQAFNQESS